jgi:hypothetical protein
MTNPEELLVSAPRPYGNEMGRLCSEILPPTSRSAGGVRVIEMNMGQQDRRDIRDPDPGLLQSLT